MNTSAACFGHSHLVRMVILLGAMSALSCCSGDAPPRALSASSDTESVAEQPTSDPYAGVNTVARDRGVWQQLLTDHGTIRRVLRHSEKDGVGVVESLTESDNAVVAARIKDHALAMQARMRVGATVRVWDPVFKELFASHDKVTLEVTPTDKGVEIVESSADPHTIALMRSHAMGVSAFVRQGHAAGGEATRRLAVGDPLPPDEVAIGGLPHRFLLSQPTPGQVAMLRKQGVGRLVNFRKHEEHTAYDEFGTVTAAGATYCNLPFRDASELTDELLTSARAEYARAAQDNLVLAPHCRTGNRVGPGLAAYLAVDLNTDVERAISAAKTVGMIDPLFESITRDYIRRVRAPHSRGTPTWTPATVADLSPAQKMQRMRAEAARAVMLSRLFARLGEAMATPGANGQPVGPAGAIDVCKTEAPKIAQAVAREKGVMIGRTSDRLRNPGNTAPSWAAQLLHDKPTEPRTAVSTDGSLGITLPITLAANCLACHGAPEQIDHRVRAALATAYAKDHATGYADGDLRGWFWVEVPPANE